MVLLNYIRRKIRIFLRNRGMKNFKWRNSYEEKRYF